MKVKIEKIYEPKKIGLICMVCGKYLGNLQYIDELSNFSPINHYSLCNKCFKEKIGEANPPASLQHPLAS